MKNLVILVAFLIATTEAFCQQAIAGYRVVSSGTGMYQDHLTPSGSKTLGESKWAQTGAELVNASGVVPHLKVKSNGVDITKIDSKNFVWMCDTTKSQWTHVRSYTVSELEKFNWWNSAVYKQELVLMKHHEAAKIITFEKEGIIVPLKKSGCENLQYFSYIPPKNKNWESKKDTVYVMLKPSSEPVAVTKIDLPDSGFDQFMSGFKTVQPTVVSQPCCYSSYIGSNGYHYQQRGGRWWNVSLGFWVNNYHVQPVAQLPIGSPGAGGGDPSGGPSGGGGDNPGPGGGHPGAGWGH